MTYVGRGFLNRLINKLPVELHIPGYQYCGPGTKLQKRIARGDSGRNPLDAACKQHDIAYAQTDNVQARHVADRILMTQALQRVRSRDASFGERLAALGVAGAMKAKVTVGAGIRNKRRRRRAKPRRKLITARKKRRIPRKKRRTTRKR